MLEELSGWDPMSFHGFEEEFWQVAEAHFTAAFGSIQ
jgi:hypothetical protein